MEEVSLRALTDDDLPILFGFYSDPVSVAMAGMPHRDEEAFFAHRAKTMANPANVLMGIMLGGELVGDIGSWPDEGGQRKLGYWIGREYWGRGIATAALTAFLGEVTERPLYADVLKTNVGSLRVLQKCGFRLLDDDECGADHDPKEYTLRLGSGLVPLAANGVRQHGRAGPRWAGVPISGGRWCMLR